MDHPPKARPTTPRPRSMRLCPGARHRHLQPRRRRRTGSAGRRARRRTPRRGRDRSSILERADLVAPTWWPDAAAGTDPRHCCSTATSTWCRGGRRLADPPLRRRDPRRHGLGPRSRRHEGHGRDDPGRRPALGEDRDPAPPRRRRADAPRRGGGRTAGLALAGRPSPELFAGVTEAVGEVGGFSMTVRDDLRLYLVQIAEKGMAWMRLRAAGPSGHGSMLNDDNAVTALCQRCRPRRDAPVPGARHAHHAGVRGRALRRAGP